MKAEDKILGLLESSLKDETKAKNEYETLIELTSKCESLTDIEKSLMTGILFKIQVDEKTHDVLLSILVEVLKDKQSA